MPEPAAVAEEPVVPGRRTHQRVRAGMRKEDNWFQLLRFGVVGGSGFVVNLVIFWLFVHPLGQDYRLAAIVAYLVAVTNNFLVNRIWTFRHDAAGGHAGFQAMRFFVVSLGAQVIALGILELMVTEVGAEKVVAQGVAVAAATPLNFLGNKLWSFAR